MSDELDAVASVVSSVGKLPVMIVLVLSGVVFLLLAVLGKIGSWVDVSSSFRIVGAVVGSLLLLFVLVAYWETSVKHQTKIQPGAVRERKILTGFHEIFAEASRLVANAEREILIVNFVLHLGAPHLANKEIADDYFKLTGKARTLKDDVETLLTTFREKVKSTPKVRILTITDVHARDNFLEHLKRTTGYESLDLLREHEDIRSQKVDFETWTKDRPSRLPQGADSRCELFEAPRLPIQLLIVGLKSDEGDVRPKSACLAFMVGTETLESNLEEEPLTGFYTEIPNETIIFKNMVTALIRQDKIEKRVECR